MRRPDFIGIGVMKAATTWVWYQLNAHPSVNMPFQKELHYFDQLNMTPEHYLERFSEVSKRYKTGEITPSYFSVPHAPMLCRRLCPDTKIFVILRNPIERAFSHWKVSMWSEGKIPLGTPFIQAFNQGHPWGSYWHSIKERGIYVKHLKRWYEEYPKEQIKLMWYDTLEKDPISFIKELYEWLGLDKNFLSKNHKQKFNENWSGYEPKYKIEDRKKVLKFYLPSIEKLEEMTGKNLSNWKII